MKVNIYKVEKPNSGELVKTEEAIIIKRGKWSFSLHPSDHPSVVISHPMKFDRKNMFNDKYVYFLHLFGDDSKEPHLGRHISLTFWENQKFLLMQGEHWIQKPEGWLSLIISITSLIVSLVK